MSFKEKKSILHSADVFQDKCSVLINKNVIIGFDGFVDEIIHVVSTREDKNIFSRIETITEFGNRILSAAGKSANMELVPLQEKIGGNGPLMLMALSNYKVNTSCIGLLGYPEVLPVFKPLEDICKIISIGNPGHTDAIEFLDGKLLFGKLNSLKEMNWENLVKSIGEKEFIEMLCNVDLVGCTNWTMLTEMEGILDNIIRLLPKETKTTFFFDLADPEKRTINDKKILLFQLQQLNKKAKTILGLNFREAEQLISLLGIPIEPENSPEGLAYLSEQLNLVLKIHGIVIHALGSAGAFVDNECFGVSGPFCANPKLTTGGGDHFNGGFCSALLSGADLTSALYVAVATSGWYVRNGISPKPKEVIELLRLWANDKLND